MITDRQAASRFNRNRLLLLGAAAFAMLWSVVRACRQAITIDEAGTYLAWVAGPLVAHWNPHSNNHVLNSLLMRFFTWAFGAHPVTIRAPALIGAALYIAAAHCLCRLLTRSGAFGWALFVCMVYNPLVMDFMVAARGYSLAMGFFVWALAIAAYRHTPEGARTLPLRRAAALCSVCLALSFSGNFSFAFVDAAALLVIFMWFRQDSTVGRWRLLAWCALPGLLAAIILTGTIALRIFKADLSYGTTSLHEMVNSLLAASLYRLNPNIVNPLLMPLLERVKRLLFPLLALAVILRVAALLRRRPAARDAGGNWVAAFGAAVGAIAALALTVHWLAFRLLHIPLPRDRTGIYLVPLFMLLTGAVAEIPSPWRPAAFLRRAVVALTFVMGSYFFLCLRAGYFKEWQWGADIDRAYSVVAYYNRTYDVREIGAAWLYVVPLRFYREISGHETISEFVGAPERPLPPDEQVYVLHDVLDREFIERQKLKIVYRSPTTDVVVAIRPELEARSPIPPCR
jgi:hypothetical protein